VDLTAPLPKTLLVLALILSLIAFPLGPRRLVDFAGETSRRNAFQQFNASAFQELRVVFVGGEPVNVSLAGAIEGDDLSARPILFAGWKHVTILDVRAQVPFDYDYLSVGVHRVSNSTSMAYTLTLTLVGSGEVTLAVGARAAAVLLCAIATVAVFPRAKKPSVV